MDIVVSAGRGLLWQYHCSLVKLQRKRPLGCIAFCDCPLCLCASQLNRVQQVYMYGRKSVSHENVRQT